ncbi:MAG TPA: transporter substrate-binding domain-containing protein, partial [Candidatus Sulfotelmatobacter sp.]|nr:transporter substrate-binding domain-containing protein [Candidatus Sulfotelmatobacter sp.]
MSKKLAPMISLLLASALPAFPQTSAQSPAQDQNADLQDLAVHTSPHKGDLDEMDQRRVVRALVTFNRASFFFDNGRPRGMTYDTLVDFEKFLNRKLHPKDTTGKEKINVVLIPTTFEKAASDLQNGNGDLVAAAVYITEARKKIFDFVPLANRMHDVVVAGPGAPLLANLEDLSGKEVYLLRNSVSWENLTELNKKLSVAKKPKITLIAADGNLERDDLIEMAQAGLVQYTVTPSFTAQLWKNVFTDLKIYEDFPVTDKMESGWALRKDSPKLRAVLEEFASTHHEGTAYFAQLANTYLKSGHFIKNNENAESVKRFNQMKGLFQ